MVRFVAKRRPYDSDMYQYPFGRDPVAKAELRKLRRGIRESRRLKNQRRVILGRLDALLAEGKEQRKRFPFKRKSIGESPDPD